MLDALIEKKDVNEALELIAKGLPCDVYLGRMREIYLNQVIGTGASNSL